MHTWPPTVSSTTTQQAESGCNLSNSRPSQSFFNKGPRSTLWAPPRLQIAWWYALTLQRVGIALYAMVCFKTAARAMMTKLSPNIMKPSTSAPPSCPTHTPRCSLITQCYLACWAPQSVESQKEWTHLVCEPKSAGCNNQLQNKKCDNIRALSDNRRITYCTIIEPPLIPNHYWMCVYLHSILKKSVDMLSSHQKHNHARPFKHHTLLNRPSVQWYRVRSLVTQLVYSREPAPRW